MKYIICFLFFISFLTAEPITRESSDFHYLEIEPKTNPAPLYPWTRTAKLSPITKEHFRCRGNKGNPIRDGVKDCGEHSLPIRDGEEFIYPILIKILNSLQEETGHKVIITSGHRCPEHNAYIDDSPQNEVSKHQIGAEVSFFVEGLESSPEKIVDLIIQFYKDHKDSAYKTFKRYEKTDTNVSTLPWYNKEIFIKLFKATEGRSLDNKHHYPYVSIQVRFDSEREENVVYSWPSAHRKYYRY